ncbi:hypothetical protein GCM10023321_73450 [Pseudonocardia eucalypti]|uniref:Uncharacterized protein n=1 Tax=Pseudonocardia eucalypti TaxID=648755 RepID=A0ABP9R850_9PSEU
MVGPVHSLTRSGRAVQAIAVSPSANPANWPSGPVPPESASSPYPTAMTASAPTATPRRARYDHARSTTTTPISSPNVTDGYRPGATTVTANSPNTVIPSVIAPPIHRVHR